jgi:hypothetical protein
MDCLRAVYFISLLDSQKSSLARRGRNIFYSYFPLLITNPWRLIPFKQQQRPRFGRTPTRVISSREIRYDMIRKMKHDPEPPDFWSIKLSSRSRRKPSLSPNQEIYFLSTFLRNLIHHLPSISHHLIIQSTRANRSSPRFWDKNPFSQRRFSSFNYSLAALNRCPKVSHCISIQMDTILWSLRRYRLPLSILFIAFLSFSIDTWSFMSPLGSLC